MRGEDGQIWGEEGSAGKLVLTREMEGFGLVLSGRED